MSIITKTIPVFSLLLFGVLLIGCARPYYVSTPDRQGRAIQYADTMLEINAADQVATTGSYRDHPLRAVAFALHPVGVVLEYAIRQPTYILISKAPPLFGYTIEDAQLEGQSELLVP